MKKFEIFAYIFSALFCAWLLASFINVNIHNTTDYNYAAWNAFALFLRL